MSGRFFPLNHFSSSSFFTIFIFKTKERKKERKKEFSMFFNIFIAVLQLDRLCRVGDFLSILFSCSSVTLQTF